MSGWFARHMWVRWIAALGAALLVPANAHAGMTVYSLSDIVAARLEVISFFIVLSLMLAFVFQRCWNGLAKDFSWMPALNFRKSLAVIFVASLFCGLILTMISGARELMTPGAWDKVGTGYKLREPKHEPMVWLDSARRRAMEQFRDALWNYAHHHDGKLPDDPFATDIPPTVWRSPDLSGSPYGYLPRRDRTVGAPSVIQKQDAIPAQGSGSYVLAYEPMTFGQERFVLFSSGEVVKLKAKELMDRVAADTEADQTMHALVPAKS